MKYFKIFLASVLLTLQFTEISIAATKVESKSADFTITYNAGTGDQVNSGQLIGNSLVIASTIDNPTLGYSNANLTSYGLDGAKQWELPLTGEALAGPQSKDKLGNIYLVGSTTSPIAAATPPASDPAAINPDNVQSDPVVTPQNSLTNLIVWKVSATGQLIQSYTLAINEVLAPKSISPTTTGFKIIAATPKKYIQVSFDQTGTFGNPKTIKAPKIIDITSEFKSGPNKLKFYISTKSIIGIPSWKPKKPTPVLIQYSKYGAIKGANFFQGTPLFILFQPNVGVIVGCESTTGFGVSIVKPLL